MSAEARKFAEAVQVPAPPGAPHSVPVPGTEQQDRTAVYRHWRFKDGIMKTVDPNVKLKLP